jgi:uncharacterized protein (TIGR03435 family)
MSIRPMNRGVLVAGMVTATMLCACGTVSAQAAAGSASAKPAMMAADADPDWEVVTVRPADPDDKNNKFDVQGRHAVIESHPVEIMLMFAYNLQKSQIAGLPEWAKTERFNVDGVPNVDGQPDVQQFQSMVRKLLAERFGLKEHMEQREMPVFALTVAKDGPKLTKTTGDPNGRPSQSVRGGSGERHIEFTNTSMKDMTLLMLLEVDRPIVDQTGLQGKYDFKLNFTNDESRAPTDGSAPPGLFTAMQEQLGLKLEPVRAPAPVLVVDSVQRPTAN